MQGFVRENAYTHFCAYCWAEKLTNYDKLQPTLFHIIEGLWLMAQLYFYYSAMNAGKSTALLQSSYNYQERGMRTVVYTAEIDDRFGIDFAQSEWVFVVYCDVSKMCIGGVLM